MLTMAERTTIKKHHIAIQNIECQINADHWKGLYIDIHRRHLIPALNAWANPRIILDRMPDCHSVLLAWMLG